MLLDRKGCVTKDWLQDDQTPRLLIRWEALGTCDPAETNHTAWGLEIPNTLRIDDLLPWLSHISLLSIRFPSFSDGRGFSLARLVRRHGYRGLLRAQGPLIPDEFYYLTQCGFDEVLLPDASAQRQTSAQWQQALALRKGGYQQGYEQASSILQARRRARQAL